MWDLVSTSSQNTSKATAWSSTAAQGFKNSLINWCRRPSLITVLYKSSWGVLGFDSEINLANKRQALFELYMWWSDKLLIIIFGNNWQDSNQATASEHCSKDEKASRHPNWTSGLLLRNWSSIYSRISGCRAIVSWNIELSVSIKVPQNRIASEQTRQSMDSKAFCWIKL